jgi:hypothetical protein
MMRTDGIAVQCAASRMFWRVAELRVERTRTPATVVHGQHVDEVLADRVVDAVGKATKPSATHSAVRSDMGLGQPLDPRDAGLHGSEEGFAEPLGARLVDRND